MKTIAPNTTTSSPVSATKNEPAGDGNLQQQFQTPNAATGGNKRPVSLDLNKQQPPKKQRLGPSPLILESPDLHNLKTPSLNPLNTPDIEKILLSSNLLQTPDPGAVFPTEVRPVTSAQEAFGKGFDEALYSLHNSKNSQTQLINTSTGAVNAPATVTTTSNPITNQVSTNTVTGMSGGSFTYTNLESSFPVAIKDEPHIPSGSPPVSPIDMETQEKIKLERKRQRNRVAASKCRKRKLERISKLEDKVKILKGENTDLGSVVKTLKDHVAQLKQQVIQHIETGCSVPTMYNGNALLQGK